PFKSSLTARDTVTGCTSSPFSITINPAPGAPSTPTATVTQPTCSTSTGTIVVTSPLGAQIKYSIGGTYQSSVTFSGLTPATYSLTERDTVTGCTSSPFSITINPAPTPPTTPTANVTQPTCSVSTGSIVVTSPLGAQIKYSIGGTYQSSITFSGLTPATYSLTARDTVTGCTSSPFSITINPAPGAPSTPTATVTQPTCSVSTGTITVTSPLGAQIKYSIGGAEQSSITFSGLTPATYSLTARDTVA